MLLTPDDSLHHVPIGMNRAPSPVPLGPLAHVLLLLDRGDTRSAYWYCTNNPRLRWQQALTAEQWTRVMEGRDA